jgi:hypothetical protein
LKTSVSDRAFKNLRVKRDPALTYFPKFDIIRANIKKVSAGQARSLPRETFFCFTGA